MGGGGGRGVVGARFWEEREEEREGQDGEKGERKGKEKR